MYSVSGSIRGTDHGKLLSRFPSGHPIWRAMPRFGVLAGDSMTGLVPLIIIPETLKPLSAETCVFVESVGV